MTQECATEVGNRMIVALPNPPNADYYCYYETVRTYDLTCDAVVVKVPELTRAALGLQTFLYIVRDDDHKMILVVESTGIVFGLDGGAAVTGENYDPRYAFTGRIGGSNLAAA